MAREVLDVQRYPDLRQYPGGPPERPYDAAGWTLPLQMGVRVVAGDDPAGRRCAREDEAARAGAGPEGQSRRPTTRAEDRRGAVRQRARRRLRHPSWRRGDRSAGRAHHRSGPVARARSGAEQHLSRDQPRVGAAAPPCTLRRTAATLVDPGLSETQQDDLVKSLALVGGASRRRPAARRQPRIGLFRPWSGSMDEGWTRWLLEQYGFDVRRRCAPTDFKSPLTRKIRRRSSSRTMRDCRSQGRGRRARAEARGPADAAAPGAARVRRSVCRRPISRASSSSSAAAARSSASTTRARSRSSSSSCRSGTSSPA